MTRNVVDESNYDIVVCSPDKILSELEFSNEATREPTLVVLLRHLACNCAADRLQEAITAVREAGLEGKVPILVIASSTSPTMAAQLLAEDASVSIRAARKLRLRVRLDPQRAAYLQLQCKSGMERTLCFSRQRAAFNFMGLLRFPYEMCCKGRVPGINSGAPFQLGGVFLLVPVYGSAVREAYAMREQRPGWPLIDVAALRAAAVTENKHFVGAVGASLSEIGPAKKRTRRASQEPVRKRHAVRAVPA